MILLSEDQLKGWGASLLLFSLLLSLFPVSFQKRDWMLDVDLSQCGSVHKEKKKKEREEEDGGRRAVNTARQQKLIEQKKTLERGAHSTG